MKKFWFLIILLLPATGWGYGNTLRPGHPTFLTIDAAPIGNTVSSAMTALTTANGSIGLMRVNIKPLVSPFANSLNSYSQSQYVIIGENVFFSSLHTDYQTLKPGDSLDIYTRDEPFGTNWYFGAIDPVSTTTTSYTQVEVQLYRVGP